MENKEILKLTLEEYGYELDKLIYPVDGLVMAISEAMDRARLDQCDKTVLRQTAVSWVAFDWDKIETRPTKCGKYLICRKDGKIHWETWNGSGWAYNHNEIRYWAVILPPCI